MFIAIDAVNRLICLVRWREKVRFDPGFLLHYRPG